MAAKVGLFKELWHKYPEVIGALFVGGIGFVGSMGFISYNLYHGSMDRYRQHKLWYTVRRPSDVKNPDDEIYN